MTTKALEQSGLFDQPGLFDVAADGPQFEPLGGHVHRTELTDGAWVEVRPGWLTGSDELLHTLLAVVPWRAERRQMYDRVVAVPRLVSFYEQGAALPDPLLAAARAALDDHYRDELREPFTTAGLCCYRDGSDSVAWHGDTIGRGRTEDTMVAILSLGADRPLLLRPRGGGPSMRFAAGHGDLLVMGGSCQRTWEHCIPKTLRPTGTRVSVQFRPCGVR
ncbi:alpha-ketoglutarate-dependent dioxygenase AlkB [Rhodococcus sp. D2-41]|uniref:alpha-ketoglutarate-dependent dioxygenase AlkB n=1 Tax=Speluncibacter jeojiensis TaxID=2710754 RepID=UPI00240FB5E8|nr:alpha-ketoglutarate-dependent dioxygenase AlkB [Rhodococcus sp. D2-41]MDG3011796.1 alpha-ketoglutarate-dependent dioxygenase AlkB [Rhodococcus sp. D2-41]